MTRLLLIMLTLFSFQISFAQKKSELDQKIQDLEKEISTLKTNLESEISNIKINLTNTSTTMSLVSKSNTDLEKLVTEQKILIEKLIKQNDSLLTVFKINREADYVSIPKTEEDSIIHVIQSYFACKKWEDRLAYVLKPEIVKSFMKESYTDEMISSEISKNYILITGSGYKTNESFKVVVGRFVFYLKKTSKGFKIDWEASNGYNPISLKTFKATLNSNPTEFRIWAELGSYYNYNYRNANNTHWSVKVSTDNYESISCYINKASEEGKKIFEILKNGKRHKMILEIKIDATEDKSGDIAIITKVIKEGWSLE